MKRSVLAVVVIAQVTVFKACPPCPSVFTKQGTVVNVSQISTPPLQIPGANATCGPTGWLLTLPPPPPQPPQTAPADPATLLPKDGPAVPTPLPAVTP